MSKVLVISTSLRAKSNSDIMTECLVKGAKAAGHEVEQISLKGKELKFCIGCLACQKTQKCVLKDDAVWIAEKVKNADTLVFATPIYYYEMSGQMKTLLDRLNPLYPSDYKSLQERSSAAAWALPARPRERKNHSMKLMNSEKRWSNNIHIWR